MNAALLLLAAVELVNGGRAQLRLESDGDAVAVRAASILRHHVTLMTGASLPETGAGPALRFERTSEPGYAIRTEGAGAVVAGRDLVRAAYDLLDAWGCVFDGPAPRLPRRADLQVALGEWRPARALFWEDSEPLPHLPIDGVSVRGPAAYDRRREPLIGEAARHGWRLRVVSPGFDPFLPPERWERNPEWFALRGGRREARGNFCLSTREARAACLDGVALWWESHPEVETLGLWPEATVVWCECEACTALGPEEAYALLWREAAERFSTRSIEILASGATLRPPSGVVPRTVEVRLAPGRDGCGLHGALDAACPGNQGAIAAAWRARGARLLLEIDAAPAPWCGLPWPCLDAIRASAPHFAAGVVRGGGALHARAWRDPQRDPGMDARQGALHERARGLHSWGDARDAGALFAEDAEGAPGAVARAERALVAGDATATLFAYLDACQLLPDAAAKSYARYRGAEFRRLVEARLPQGAGREIGPARVQESFERLVIETLLLRLVVDRREARVIGLARRIAGEWSPDFAGAGGVFFSVAPLGTPADRRDGRVRLTSPAEGRLLLELRGLSPDGEEVWSSRLSFSGASPVVAQRARVEGVGGLASGCRWKGGELDHWICPPHAAEGRLMRQGQRSTFPLPAGTLLYCRAGERGAGLAARLPRGGLASLDDAEQTTLALSHPGREAEIEWIVLASQADLGH
ncbi:MAG: DUF4838 domain-containing protein [Planctomycetaceae bacterium]